MISVNELAELFNLKLTNVIDATAPSEVKVEVLYIYNLVEEGAREFFSNIIHDLFDTFTESNISVPLKI